MKLEKELLNQRIDFVDKSMSEMMRCIDCGERIGEEIEQLYNLCVGTLSELFGDLDEDTQKTYCDAVLNVVFKTRDVFFKKGFIAAETLECESMKIDMLKAGAK